MFLKTFFQFIKEYGKGYKLKFFMIALFSLLMGGFEFLGLALIFPFVMLLAGNNSILNIPLVNSLFDKLNLPLDTKTIAFVFCLVIVFIYIFKNIFMILCTKYQNKVMADFQFDLYSKTFKNLMNMLFTKFNKLSYGDKTTLLGNTLNSIIWNFVYKVILLISNGIIALCILSFLFYKFPIPAFFTALFLAAFVYIEQLFFKKRAKKYGAENLRLTKIQGSLFQYTMKGAKEIKISKNKDKFIEDVIQNFKETNNSARLLTSNAAYPVYVTEIGIIISFGILASLTFCLQSSASSFLVSSLAVIAAIVLRLVPILNKVQSSMFGINQSRSHITWFMETVKKIESWVEEEPKSCSIPFNSSIKLTDVNFSYENNKNFNLKDINLEIKKGEFIGIVGLSGSGKTTLLDILTGLNTPSSGKLFIDNIEINKTNVKGLQNHISILPQEFFLMPLSVIKNIAFGENEDKIDREKIVSALKKADIYDAVKDLNKIPELSHGQKHRLALARAFYQDSDILFLDEATSSLDIETEDRISKTIAGLKGEKTIIAIAHRLSTLKECDALIYIKEGKIVDKGTFKELKEKYPDFENMLELSTFNIP